MYGECPVPTRYPAAMVMRMSPECPKTVARANCSTTATTRSVGLGTRGQIQAPPGHTPGAGASRKLRLTGSPQP